MSTNKNLEKFIVWRDAHISQRQMVYILSLIIGIISGLAAVLLKNAALLTHELIINRLPENRVSLLYLLTPLLGIVLAAIFVRFIIKDDISHGISKILFSISKQNGRLRSHNMFSSLIGSILTVGFGGSVGLRRPR